MHSLLAPLRHSGLPQGARAKGEEEQSPRCTVWGKKERQKRKREMLGLHSSALGSLTQSSRSLRQLQAQHASVERLHFWMLLLVTFRQGHPLDPCAKEKG